MNLTRVGLSPLLALLFGLAATLGVAQRSDAATIQFGQITSNGAQSPVGQLSAQVSQSGGQVLFKFVNASGGIASRISEVYWDDDLALLSNGPVVDPASTLGVVDLSSIPASPANVPSGNNVGFAANFSAGRRMSAANGVDPGETAGFLFDGDTAAVIAALTTGDLRLGMHVISIAGDGQSESFVNQIVPEPAALLIVVTGVLSVRVRAGRS